MMKSKLLDVIHQLDSATVTDKRDKVTDFRHYVARTLIQRISGYKLGKIDKYNSLRGTTEKSCTFEYANLWSMNGDLRELKELFSGAVDMRNLIILDAFLSCSLVDSDLSDLCDNGESDDFEEALEEAQDYANGALEEFDKDVDVPIDEMRELYFAILEISKHNYDEALNNYTICDYCEGIASMFNDVFDEKFVLKNIEIFIGLFFKNECNASTIHVIASKEVKEYYSYRESIPDDTRDEVDQLIDYLNHPFDRNFFALSDSIVGDKYWCILVDIFDQYDDNTPYTEDDMKLSYIHVIELLDVMLPELRAKYGSAEKCSHIFYCHF